jgi:hypothetical protein
MNDLMAALLMNGKAYEWKLNKLSRLHVQVLVLTILQMFNEGTFCGVADIVSVFEFSPHFAK